MKSINASRRALIIIGHLTDQAQETARTEPLPELKSESGITIPLREMNKALEMDTVTLLHVNILGFNDHSWDQSMSDETFVDDFHRRLDKICKLHMNEKLKDVLLVKQADLDSHVCNLVVAAAGGVYSLRTLATSVRKAFW